MFKSTVLISVVLSLSSFSAFAMGRHQSPAIPAPPVGDTPMDDLQSYKKAVQMALGDTWWSCDNGQGNYREVRGYNELAGDYVSDAASGTVSPPGEQPLLTFTDVTYQDMETSQRFVVKITSSPDYKSATAIEVDNQSWVEVNSGTLQNPSISSEWKTSGSVVCKSSAR